MHYITQTIEPWMPAGALKAKADLAQIAEDQSWQRLPIERYNDVRFSDEVRSSKIDTMLKRVMPGDIIVHQFPTYMSENFEKEFQQAIQKRGAKYTLLIHDFEPLRVERKKAWEWQLAEKADLIVAHSQQMIEQFKAHGIHSTAITINLFDYLGISPASAPTFEKVINYAGTWQKAPWLQTYNGPALRLFGSRPKKWKEIELPSTVEWVGSFPPDEITLAFQSGFGLLWDSDYDDKYFQSYTKINAPHKASLYIKASLPIIVWSHSYLADMVNERNIGFTIDSLDELEASLQQIDQQTYRMMQANLRPIQNRVNQGQYTAEMLEKVIDFFK
ncbi:sugar transferase [Fructobacillus sp. CRL 2054]|uniref:sugar transferase n=1 Tax=Fructobacillus sp. CRL 2054 TaxID=2763007 RepID=UPI002377FACF|nr:sugar transferase [Fructobacillus sp. CRL 2054]MDD9138769.1 sugar transferase [Fructobacillus sp. CRL 2054]